MLQWKARGVVEMRDMDSSQGKTLPKSHPFRDDPNYLEIKKMIENFPADRMKQLKMYIERWLRDS
jgi:hypothetical protein